LSVDEVIAAYMGLSFSTMINDLLTRFPGRLPSNFAQILQARTSETFDHELRAIDGASEALSKIQLRTCVASSSAPERIRHSLLITGLLPHFQERLFSATQVAHGKPKPDLFLFAAEKMSALADDCIVVEDSVPGVQASTSAGMRALGFTGGSHCQPGHADKLLLEGAVRTFERMSELPPIIAELSKP
jgi:HAD superfamily hydrolase (TIGR01509 family)